MRAPDRCYRSYLLRLWPVKQNGQLTWRSSLEEVGTGNRLAFSNLDTLCQYLKMNMTRQDDKEVPK
jgi:hypothetical protein